MASESADQRFLLAQEADLWHAEAERTQNRLDDPQQGSFEAEQAWYDYCFRKHEEVARELDKIENPQNYSAGNVARHENLDDLDRQTE
jgi:hypothetical protein